MLNQTPIYWLPFPFSVDISMFLIATQVFSLIYRTIYLAL